MRMDVPRVIIFDLDNTLAESKQPLTRAMAHLLEKLLERTKVAVISGGALEQFLRQVVAKLSADARMKNLYLLPTSGAALYEWRDGGWDKIYEERIPENDARAIETAIMTAAEASGVVDLATDGWGPRIEYRGGEVTFSALGQGAPIFEKKAWDPDHSKRKALQREIAKRLPVGYTAGMGGSTSVDVTKTGVDKAYGIHQLSARFGINEKDMLYVGDELIEHGNDEAVWKTQAKTKAVKNPTETARFIGQLLDI